MTQRRHRVRREQGGTAFGEESSEMALGEQNNWSAIVEHEVEPIDGIGGIEGKRRRHRL